MSKAITAKQQQVLEFIRSYLDAHGWAPTCDEMRAHFMWASPNSATEYIRALEKNGAITKSSGKARTIRVVSQ
jgi:repressor LexA